MKVDLSSVPESTTYAVIRLVQLSEDSHSGEVIVTMHEGGVRNVEERRDMDTADLRRLAAKENGR